jgi:hypothetical protein
LALQAEQFAEVTVQQRGIDVVVESSGAYGKVLAEGVSPSQVAAGRRHDSRRDGGATFHLLSG